MENVLVTGGARRLGRVMAEAIAAPDRRVVIHYNASSAEADALVAALGARGLPACAIQADLASVADADRLVEAACEMSGAPLTGLVNSASVFDYDAPGGVDPAVFATSMEVNLRAPVLLARRFYETCDPAADNCVVNILDQKIANLNPDFFSYTLAKAALAAATEMQAAAFAPKARVNAIAPGLLFASFDQTEDEFRQVASLNPLERPIDPEEVGRALAFLLSNPGVTGQILPVDNGQRLAPRDRDVMFSVRDEA